MVYRRYVEMEPSGGHHEPRKALGPWQRKALPKKVKHLGYEGMLMPREIGRKEAASWAKSGNKLVTPMRPTLNAADSSVSGNACKKHKTNSFVCSALRPTSTLLPEARAGTPRGDQISERHFNEACYSQRNTNTKDGEEKAYAHFYPVP